MVNINIRSNMFHNCINFEDVFDCLMLCVKIIIIHVLFKFKLRTMHLYKVLYIPVYAYGLTL